MNPDSIQPESERPWFPDHERAVARFLRAEMDAIRVYAVAVRKFFGRSGLAALRTILEEHDGCVGIVRTEWSVGSLGLPREDPVWKSALGTLSLVGSGSHTQAILQPLVTAEAATLDEYRAAVCGLCTPDFASTIENIILPRKEANLELLRQQAEDGR